jgi:hypothetical protein
MHVSHMVHFHDVGANALRVDAEGVAPHVLFRNHHKLGEGPIPIYPNTGGELAQVATASAKIAAVTTHNVPFARNQRTNLNRGDSFAEFNNVA